jgi:hypothetical protein
MDFNEIENKIKILKYPLIFIRYLTNNLNYFTDHEISVVLRLIFKHHFDLCYSLPLYQLEKYFQNYEISKSVIIDFYSIMRQQYKLYAKIYKWYLIYDNKEFWQLNIENQINEIKNIKHKFSAIFDCSSGGVPLFVKASQLLKNDKSKDIIKDEIKNRLILSVKFFGIKFFNTVGIPLISCEEFDELSNDKIIKYVSLVYFQIIHTLDQSYILFNTLNNLNVRLNNLLTPNDIQIDDICLSPEITLDDIKFYLD